MLSSFKVVPMIRQLLFSSVVVVSVLTGCDGAVATMGDLDGGAGGGTGTGGTGGGGGSLPPGTGATVSFCEVAAVLQSRCASCHGATPVAGAPKLVTKDDLLAASPRGGTMLDRAIARMAEVNPALAMPPGVGGSDAEVATLVDWLNSGTPDCTGPLPDAGVPTPTCTSNSYWVFGNLGSPKMNPGEACASCHRSRRDGPLAGFMGTVYPGPWEKDLCVASSIPAGLAVQILDSTNTVRYTFPVSTSNNGNFYGGSVGTPSPYRARVVINGVVKSEMFTWQTDGDCNTCHTVTGTNGAPGRIHW